METFLRSHKRFTVKVCRILEIKSPYLQILIISIYANKTEILESQCLPVFCNRDQQVLTKMQEDSFDHTSLKVKFYWLFKNC